MEDALNNVILWIRTISSSFLEFSVSGISVVGFIIISYLIGAILVLFLNDSGASVRLSNKGNKSK